MESLIFSTACDYDKLQLSVVPIAPMVAESATSGMMKISKRPALQAGQLKTAFEVRADDAALRQWFVEGAHANLGICCGQVSNIIVVDCDTQESYDNLAARDLPVTPICKTRRGYHIYFQNTASTAPLKNGPSAIPHVDVKTSGGYVIAPPSCYADGSFTYTWVNDILTTPFAPMPDWLLKMLTIKKAKEYPPSQKNTDQLLEEIANTQPGQRNDVLNRNAFIIGMRIVQDKLDEADITKRAIAAGLQSGLAVNEVQPTVHAAIHGGMAAQGQIANNRMPCHNLLADLVFQTHNDVIRSDRGWMTYASGIWSEANDNAINTMIVSTVVDHFGPDNPLTKSHIESIRCIMASKADKIIPANMFDAQPDYMVFSNGVLCIADNSFGPFRMELYSTVKLPYAYDPAFKPGAWLKFIDTTFSADEAALLQEFGGYCLTTDTSLETALWLCGPRGSGKSTMIEGFKAALGSLCGFFGLAHLNRQFSLSAIVGKTLLYCTEQPTGYVSETDTLNAIISGETVAVERKYKDAYEYRPVGKVLWGMNDGLPRIHDTENGLFRRVKVLELKDRPETERDPAMKEAIKREGPGIVLWLLDGLRRLRANANKFTEVASVAAANQTFKHENDIPGNFLDEACLRDDTKYLPASFWRYFMIKRRAKKGVAKSNADATNATTPAPVKERFDILTVEEITRRYHMMDGWENEAKEEPCN